MGPVKGTVDVGLRRRDSRRATDRIPISWTGGIDLERSSRSASYRRHLASEVSAVFRSFAKFKRYLHFGSLHWAGTSSGMGGNLQRFTQGQDEMHEIFEAIAPEDGENVCHRGGISIRSDGTR